MANEGNEPIRFLRRGGGNHEPNHIEFEKPTPVARRSDSAQLATTLAFKRCRGLTKSLASFSRYPPNTNSSAVQLSLLGYYCDMNSKSLRCRECRFHKKLTISEDIANVHKETNSSCSVANKHVEKEAEENKAYSTFRNYGFSSQSRTFLAEFQKRLREDSNSLATKSDLENSKHRFESARLKSFETYNVENASLLARYGFYLESPGKLKCYACGFLILSVSWQAVVELHAMKSVECPLTTNQAFNVSLEEEEEESKKGKGANAMGESDVTNSVGKVSKGAVKKVKEETLPRVIDEGFFKRLCSFSDWSKVDEKGVSAINCAYAGFTFLANDQRKPLLTCKHCDLIMLNSLPAVDMVIEHASCSPACSFITTTRGSQYVHDAIDIRNIALQKVGKPPLNIKVTDIKTAVKMDSRLSQLPSYVAEYIRGSDVNFVRSLGFSHDIIHEAIVKCYIKTKAIFGSLPELLTEVQELSSKKGTGLRVPTNPDDPDESLVSAWPQELRSDESLGRCPQCLENPIDTQIVDCSHLILCNSCARFTVNCPQCLGPVSTTRRLFLEDGSASISDSRTVTPLDYYNS